MVIRMETSNFVNLSSYLYFIKILFISLCSYHTSYRITNIKNKFTYKELIVHLYIILIAIICTFIKFKFDSFMLIIVLIFLISFSFSISSRNNLGYSLLVVILSTSINYAIFFISMIISFLLSSLINSQNLSVNLLIIIIIHSLILITIFRLRRIKHGFSFLQSFIYNDYIDVLILNLSIIILFLFHSLSSYNYVKLFYLFINILISTVMLIFTIKKLLTLYYKHNLLVKDLNDTKSELEKKNEEISKLEKENIELNKKNHSIAHKQKALEYKINEIIGTSEFSSELSIISNDISNELSSNSVPHPISKTEVLNIDNMLEFMQSECIKNNIIFELQLNGNIQHMINKYISKEKLEILLADHIKNAIIAINSSNNINKSILVKLGIFDGIYSIYFYDSGIEFEKDVLDHLGKTPITTHKNTGGTGFGFMNTFDTLKECNASIEIKHIGPPSKDNYTKCIIIRFDNKKRIEF